MEVFITDLTEMGGGNFCVAGWSVTGARMIRPLPNGGNWPTALIERFNVAPGVLMEFNATGEAHTGDFPHSTEDTRIDAAANRGERPELWVSNGGPPSSETIRDAFEGKVTWNSIFQGRKQGVHVPRGVKCRSLWGLSINSDQITFIEEFNKLKAIIDDGDSEYICAVSSANIKSLHREGGVLGVNQAKPANTAMLARLGLARAFGSHPDKCFLMLNGLQF